MKSVPVLVIVLTLVLFQVGNVAGEDPPKSKSLPPFLCFACKNCPKVGPGEEIHTAMDCSQQPKQADGLNGKPTERKDMTVCFTAKAADKTIQRGCTTPQNGCKMAPKDFTDCVECFTQSCNNEDKSGVTDPQIYIGSGYGNAILLLAVSIIIQYLS